ncbi:hypothetical protein [Parazoarcus communis]|uniref:hypothetical protein n=1 Tax=Parazoarcus communis TaxID=41977 RepID=UPI00131F1C02|nr:hypothetical protein [Parazoarcus communis]
MSKAAGQCLQAMRPVDKEFVYLVQIKISFLFFMAMPRIVTWLIAAEFAGDPSAECCGHRESESECMARWDKNDENSCGKRVAG